MSTEGIVSRGSQVSESESISSLRSEIVSWMEVGLSSSGVMEVADLMLRWEMIKEVDEVGPGLTSMSPARRRISVSRKELCLL